MLSKTSSATSQLATAGQQMYNVYHNVIKLRPNLEVRYPSPLWRVFVGRRGAGSRLAILDMVGVLEACWCDRGRLL